MEPLAESFTVNLLRPAPFRVITFVLPSPRAMADLQGGMKPLSIPEV